MKIDLHNHTSPASSCSGISPEDLLREAVAAGLDGIAITEHGNFNSAGAVRRIAARLGLRVFVGIECATDGGHVLAFGVQPPYPAKPRPMPLATTIDWIHSQGGVAVIAHPFRAFGEFSPRDRLASIADAFDAMEVVNAHNSPDENEAALAAQRQLGLVAVAGSDTHEPGRVGQAFTVFDDDIADEAALADAIRRGACRVACQPHLAKR